MASKSGGSFNLGRISYLQVYPYTDYVLGEQTLLALRYKYLSSVAIYHGSSGGFARDVLIFAVARQAGSVAAGGTYGSRGGGVFFGAHASLNQLGGATLKDFDKFVLLERFLSDNNARIGGNFYRVA